MDWDKSIERYSLTLLGIVGALFALLVLARLSGLRPARDRVRWAAILSAVNGMKTDFLTCQSRDGEYRESAL